MGNTWEVSGWHADGGSYTFTKVYEGESFFKAAIAAIKAKRYCGMVKIEWR